MNVCTILTHHSDLSGLPATLEKLYGPNSIELEGPEDGPWIGFRVIKRKMLRKIELSFKLQQRGGILEPMLSRLHHVVGAIPASNPEIQDKLLAQIPYLNSALDVESKSRIAGGEDVIFAVTKAIEGLIFYEGNKILDKKGVLVLDFKGRVHVPDFEVMQEGEGGKESVTEQNPESQERKERIEAWLEEMKVPMNPRLPGIRSSEEVHLRSVEAISRRAIALNLVALKGEGLPQGTIQNIFRDFRMKGMLSPHELDFIKLPEPEPEDRKVFTWRYEALFALLWALGYVDDMGYPGRICDVQALVKLMYESGGAEGLQKDAQMRSVAEILDEADRYRRLYWAVYDAQLRTEKPPADLEAGVVYERFYALNWLIQEAEADWDDVPTTP